MGKVRFPSLPPPLWESKVIRSLRDMWKVMIPTLDFLGFCFFSSEHPVTVVLEKKDHLPAVCATKGLGWGSPVLCFAWKGAVREGIWAGCWCPGTYHTRCVPWSHSLADQVFSSHWNIVLVCGLLPLFDLSSSPFSGKSSCSVWGEWEVPAGFFTATLSFLSISVVSLRVHLMAQRRLLNW